MLDINGTFIFPQIKPPKQIVQKLLKIKNLDEWINIYITKCKNIYYECSKDHPMFQFDLSKSINIVCHLYYLILSKLNEIGNPSYEYEIIYAFMNNCFYFLRSQSRDTYEISLDDKFVQKMYSDYIITINVNSFKFSKFGKEIKLLRDENNNLKNNALIFFKQIIGELQNVSKLISKINIPTIKENAWKNKLIINKTIKNVETQTTFEEKKEEIIIAKKKKNETITMTTNEYMKLLSTQNEAIKLAIEMEYQKVKSNYSVFFKENPLNTLQLSNILLTSDEPIVIDSIIIWNLKLAYHCFCRELLKNGLNIKDEMKNIPPFTRFFNKIILPNITKIKGTIFAKLGLQWCAMMSLIKNTWTYVKEINLDVAFSYYVSFFLNEDFDKQFFIPPFYSLLLNSCRNIVILVEILSMYNKKESEVEKNVDDIINDFTGLFISPSAEELIYKYRNVFSEEPEYIKLLYGLM